MQSLMEKLEEEGGVSLLVVAGFSKKGKRVEEGEGVASGGGWEDQRDELFDNKQKSGCNMFVKYVHLRLYLFVLLTYLICFVHILLFYF